MRPSPFWLLFVASTTALLVVACTSPEPTAVAIAIPQPTTSASTPTSVPITAQPTPTVTPAPPIKGAWDVFLNSDLVFGLIAKGDEVWWATSGGVVRLKLEDASFTRYTVRDGLPSNDVRAITTDSKGQLWVATGRGISLFDGTTWNVVPLEVDQWKQYSSERGFMVPSTRAVVHDRNGNLWVAVDGNEAAPGGGGVVMFDGQQWRHFDALTLADRQGEKIDPLEPPTNPYHPGWWQSVFAITEDSSGNLWIGTAGGVSKYDGEKFQPYTEADGLAGREVFSIIQDQKGDMWFGTRGGVTGFDGQSWQTYTREDGMAGNYVYAIFEDLHGDIWFSGAGAGVSRYDGESWEVFTEATGLASNSIVPVAEDEVGNLWFGTANGVTRYDGEAWKTFRVNDGPAANSVLQVVEDSQGVLWFVSNVFGIELIRYDGLTWQEYEELGGSPGELLLDRLGRVWVVGNNLVGIFDGTTWKKLEKESNLPGGDHREIFEDQAGNIWITTFGIGISRFDGFTWTIYTFGDGELDNWVGISGEVDGQLWITTGSGNDPSGDRRLFRFDGEEFTLLTTIDRLNARFIRDLLVDRHGNVWVGTDRGLRKYTSDGWESVSIPGFDESAVHVIFEDREGILWFGSSGRGLFRYDGSAWRNFFSKSEVVSGSFIRSIFQDSSGALWVTAGFGRGVARFDGHSWYWFDTQNGLPDNAVSQIFEDKQGRLWFTSPSGIGRFTPCANQLC